MLLPINPVIRSKESPESIHLVSTWYKTNQNLDILSDNLKMNYCQFKLFFAEIFTKDLVQTSGLIDFQIKNFI